MTVDEEREWQWRFSFRCPMPDCFAGDTHFATPDEANADFKSHMAAHALPGFITVTNLFLPKPQKKGSA